MGRMPKVSVIIPAYNAEDFLDDTLRSVLEQTYQDFEIIVVDDGSTDGTQAVVAAIAQGQVHYIYQENRGQAAARNVGLCMARGDYIAFLDADDLWHSEMLEECVSFLDQHTHVDVAYTSYGYIDSDGGYLPSNQEWDLHDGDVLERLFVNNSFIHISATMVRRHCFEVIRLFDEDLRGTEDWDLWLRIAAAGFQFGHIHRSLAMYRRHESNATLNYKRMRDNRLAVLDKLFEHPNLTETIVHLRNKSYASFFVRSCIEAFRSNLVDSALADFTLAAEYDIDVITNLSLYFQVVCTSVPTGHTPTSQNVNIELGQQYLSRLIEHIDSLELAGVTPRDKKTAVATGHLALGMAYYSHQVDMLAARRHFGISLRYNISNWSAWTWLVRAVVGKKSLQRVHRIRELLRWHRVSAETHDIVAN